MSLKHLALVVFASGLAIAAVGCDKKPESTAAAGSEAKKGDDKKAEKKEEKAEKKEEKAAKTEEKVELKEVDLSAWGPAWKGYVAMAPAGAKVTFDDPSRQITLSETDYLKVSEAPGFEDAVAGLSKDADNKNIVKVSDTEVTYERNPPLGKQWCFDTLIKLGTDKWSCGAETFTSAETSKQLRDVCKSIKKK